MQLRVANVARVFVKILPNLLGRQIGNICCRTVCAFPLPVEDLDVFKDVYSGLPRCNYATAHSSVD